MIICDRPDIQKDYESCLQYWRPHNSLPILRLVYNMLYHDDEFINFIVYILQLIGSSLLFIHDQNKANIWMIDFAKTHPLPAGIQIDHRSPWRVGNHEDGYLIGLANLTQLFDQLSLSSTDPT